MLRSQMLCAQALWLEQTLGMNRVFLIAAIVAIALTVIGVAASFGLFAR